MNKKLLTDDKNIYKQLMKVKSLIDTISELKSLTDDHDLCLASNHLNNVLDALEVTQRKEYQYETITNTK